VTLRSKPESRHVGRSKKYAEEWARQLEPAEGDGDDQSMASMDRNEWARSPKTMDHQHHVVAIHRDSSTLEARL
jgi:hypothetical protein